MTPERLDDFLRRLAAGGSRRSALGALLGAAFAAWLPDEGEARRDREPRQRRNRRERDARRGDRHRKRDKHKNKGGKRKKDRKRNKGKSKGCKSNASEKEILGYIHKAAKKYGQSEHAMVRVARCESALDPCAFNRSGPYYGLFQFLKSTWKETPYKSKSIYDPKAQAFAAGWMWKEGRKNEWACK